MRALGVSCKATRNADKANKKIVQFNFVSFFYYNWQVVLHKGFIYSVAYSTVERIISYPFFYEI